MYTEADAAALAKAQAEFKKEYHFRTGIHTVISLGVSLIMLIITAAILYLFVFDIMPVYGDGMSPTMKSEQYIVANKLAYQMRTPQRGDVVLAGGHIYRIIGMPGEEIEIYGGHLYINGDKVTEEYLYSDVLTYPVVQKECMTVPENSYYVLCDNRKCYDDSRQGVFLNPDAISSKIMFVF